MKKKSGGKYWVINPFNYRILEVWKRYPIEISDNIVEGVLSKTKKRYNPRHVRYVITLLFCYMAQFFRSATVNHSRWILDNFGTMKVIFYDKVVSLPQPHLMSDLKRLKFSFERNFRIICERILNRENKEVMRYMDEKKRNRKFAKIFFRYNQRYSNGAIFKTQDIGT